MDYRFRASYVTDNHDIKYNIWIVYDNKIKYTVSPHYVILKSIYWTLSEKIKNQNILTY